MSAVPPSGGSSDSAPPSGEPSDAAPAMAPASAPPPAGAAAPPTPVGRRRRRRRWRLRRLLLVVVALGGVTFAANAWLLLRPAALAARARAILDRRLALPYDLGAIEVSPLGVIRVTDVAVSSPPGSRFPRVLEIPDLTVELDLLGLLAGRLPLHEIQFRRPRLYVELDEDFSIPLGRILKPEAPPDGARSGAPATDEDPLPSILVEDLEIHTCPQTVYRTTQPIRVDRFRFRLLDGHRYEFSGTANHPRFRRIRLSGAGERDDGMFEGRLDISRLQLDDRVRASLPEDFRAVWDSYRPRGLASASLDFVVAGGQLRSWRARVEVLEASLHVAGPEIALDSVSGRVEITPDLPAEPAAAVTPRQLFPARFRTVEPLRGVAWSGEARLEGSLHIDFETWQLKENDISLSLRNIPVERTRELLPESALRALDALDARGRMGLDLTLGKGANASGPASPGVGIERIELEGVRIRPRAFPFPLENLSGALTRQADGTFALEVRGGRAESPITVTGSGSPERGEPFELRVDVQNLAVDQSLRQALPAVGQRIWEMLDPGGTTDLSIILSRPRGATRTLVVGELRPTAGSLSYEHFPYRIEGITGLVRLKGQLEQEPRARFAPEVVEFSGLRGHQGTSRVELLAGDLLFPSRAGEHIALDLPITSPDLRIDGPLLRAMPRSAADLVRSFGIAGRLATEVRVFHRPDDGELDLRVEARVRDRVTVQYDALPYPLHLLEGVAHYTQSEQKTVLEGLRTDPERGAQITIDGSHSPEAGSQRHHLSLTVQVAPGEQVPGLDLGDETLVTNLPRDARELLQSLHARGYATGTLDVSYNYFGGRTTESRREEIVYNCDARLTEGAADVGISLREVSANMDIYGRAGPGPENPHHFSVQVSRGGFRFNRFVVQNAVAQIVYGTEHPIVKDARSTPEEAARPIQYRPNDDFLRRLSPNMVQRNLQIFIPRADLYGGALQGFFFVDVGKYRDFMGHFSAMGVDLAVGGRELFRSGEDYQGLVDGEVLFTGATDTPGKTVGGGRFTIRDGRLTQLPVLALFLENPLLFPLEVLDPSQRYFSDVQASFSIRNRRFIVEDYGDLVLKCPGGQTVLGKGWLDFDTRIKLLLEPQGLFLGIPGFSQLVGGLARMRVAGTLEHPRPSWRPYR